MKRTIWGSSAGRVMLEILYGVENIEREDLDIKLDRPKVARRLQIRKTRFEDTLVWLQRQGLVSNLVITDTIITLTVKEQRRE